MTARSTRKTPLRTKNGGKKPKKPIKSQSASTTDEQRQVQHKEALQRLDVPCSTPSTTHELPISTKIEATGPCWSSRGHVNVQELQQLVQYGYNGNPKQASSSKRINYWDPATASQHNCHLKRPSHDTWGILKICLYFCDDFIHNRYKLPYWKQFAQAVQPVLDVLQIPSTRIVRLLLASLPPDTTIPVHQDSGEWVPHVHRVHVPVLVHDASRILFACGHDKSNLQRIDCSPGHVFEINNCAWHAVSNCSDDYRVHLILDYVDANYTFAKPLQICQPGTTLHQTRRSVDTEINPSRLHFCILGAQKAGTTTLYAALHQHAWVIPGVRRESHCFDWRYDETDDNLLEKFFPELPASCISGDSSPSYLVDCRRIAPRLLKYVPQPKCMALVREPIARAASHYSMVTSPHGTSAQLKARGSEWRKLSIWQVVTDDLHKLRDCGVLDVHVESLTVHATTMSPPPDEAAAWDRYMELHIPMNTGSYGLIARGLYILQLQAWMRHVQDLRVLVLEQDLTSDQMPSTLASLWEFLGLPNQTIETVEAQNVRPHSVQWSKDAAQNKERQDFLQRLFAPYNQRLRRLQEEQGWTQHQWTYYES